VRGKIFTVAGDFTCAQVVACALLRLHPSYKAADVVRTHEPGEMKSEDAAVNLGTIHDPENFRFHPEVAVPRHHLTFSAYNAGRGPRIPLSCAGLVYCTYGKDILRSIAGPVVDDCIYSLYEKVYESFVVEVDALANGYPIGCSPMKYRISTDLTGRINRLNIMGRRDFALTGVPDGNREVFDRALAVAEAEFRDRVEYYINVWAPARELVKQAIQTRKKLYQTGEIVHLGLAVR
jgi:uncharacterized UPF0160 family protein